MDARRADIGFDIDPARRAREDFLATPLTSLRGLDHAAHEELGARGVRILGDLNLDRDLTILQTLKPGIIDAIICALLYPQHDPGPGCAWERLFQQAPIAYYEGFTGTPFHTQFGPVFYRGRLDGTARVLVIGQDPATDETLAGRAFVGRAGQLAQTFLTRLGLTRSYVMFNTFLYGVQSSSLNPTMTTDPTILQYRNRLFDQVKATSPLTAIIAFGAYAKASALNWPGRGALPVIDAMHPTAPSGVSANWTGKLAAAHAAIAADGGSPVDLSPFPSDIPPTDIPRRDLPFGLPPWHGTGGGTRSIRGSGGAFETQITWTAP